MAEESTSVTGTIARITRGDLVVAGMLGACIFVVGALAGVSIFTKPEQWDLVDKVIDGLLTIITTLTGSVIVKSRVS